VGDEQRRAAEPDRPFRCGSPPRRHQAFLAFFPKDGVVIDSGRHFKGHDAIRRWSDREFIGARGRMTVTEVTQKKDVVTVRADWKSNFYSGPSRFEFALDGEQIRELRIAGE
jgi:hypothetical protein